MSPGQRLMLGRCTDCSRLVYARQPHEWAHRDTHELCWPHDTGAALYCGLCSDDHPETTGRILTIFAVPSRGATARERRRGADPPSPGSASRSSVPATGDDCAV